MFTWENCTFVVSNFVKLQLEQFLFPRILSQNSYTSL